MVDEQLLALANLGMLEVEVIEGKLIRDTEIIGKMDPFVKVECQGTAYRTHTIDEGGKLPVWNETFHFYIDTEKVASKDVLKLTCLDEDYITNDLVGETDIPLASICDYFYPASSGT